MFINAHCEQSYYVAISHGIGSTFSSTLHSWKIAMTLK